MIRVTTSLFMFLISTSALAASPQEICSASVLRQYGTEAAKTFVPFPIKESADLRGSVEYINLNGMTCLDLIRCRASEGFEASMVDNMCDGQD